MGEQADHELYRGPHYTQTGLDMIRTPKTSMLASSALLYLLLKLFIFHEFRTEHPSPCVHLFISVLHGIVKDSFIRLIRRAGNRCHRRLHWKLIVLNTRRDIAS